MKKIFALSLLAILLTSCGGNGNSSESQSDSTSKEETTLELVDRAIEKLLDANGNIKNRKVTVVLEDAFLSDQGYFTMKTKTTGDTTRYTYNNVPLVDTTSKAYFYNDGYDEYELKDVAQIQQSQTATQFYTVTDYQDVKTDDYKVSTAYNAEYSEIFYNLGFGFIEGKVLADFARYIGVENVFTEIRGVDGYKDNGLWQLSYRMDAFEPGTDTVTQSIIYNDSITVTNGVITHVEQEMSNTLYIDSTPGRSSYSKTTFDFTVGEYEEFTGKYLNPNDYAEAKNE